MSIKVKDIIQSGPQQVTCVYMRTTSSSEQAHHILEVPSELKKLADIDTAEIVTFGDESLGIEIDGKVWACEVKPNAEVYSAHYLPRDIWLYIRAVINPEDRYYER